MGIPDELMSIGSFAAATQLSRKALRLYDEQGLLPPANVDPLTGYRYYRRDQRATARLIGLLRAAGMPLREIGIVLAANSGDAIARMDAYRDGLQHAAVAGAVLMTRARNHYTEDTMNAAQQITTNEQVVLSELTRPTIASIDADLGGALDRLQALALDRGLTVTGDPFGIFHAPVNEESQGPVEVCLPVDALIEHTAETRSYRIAGGQHAAVSVLGEETDFPAVLAAYDSVCAWVERHGYRLAGPPRETWSAVPWGDEPAVMTVSFPVVGVAG